MLSRRFLQELTSSIAHHDFPLHIVPACQRPFTTIVNRRRVTSAFSAAPSRTAVLTTQIAHASSSSTRWKTRQGKDKFAKEAKVQGLKSRAAFKLLEMNEKYRLFKPGNTVVDLGYAPGSWSQVAIDRTQPSGRVIGIDILPAQPPRGVSTIQGNFLSPNIQAEVRNYVQDPMRGRPRRIGIHSQEEKDVQNHVREGFTEEEADELERGYIDMERRSSLDATSSARESTASSHTPPSDLAQQENSEIEQISQAIERTTKPLSIPEQDRQLGRVVDVVLSDMSAPWDLVDGFSKRSLSDPYYRMMNTSGMAFRDHAGSMDLCLAALTFSFDTLKTGGHFLCKFYQGAEDKDLEKKLRKLFEKVHREKPESSRSESKEAYFVGLKRKASQTREDVFG